MDPNIALKEVMEVARKIVAGTETDQEYFNADANDLAGALIDLDEWIRKGGFLPEAWEREWDHDAGCGYVTNLKCNCSLRGVRRRGGNPPRPREVEALTGAPVMFPEVVVRLKGRTEANGFTILGETRKALRESYVTDEDIEAFTNEACNGNYDHLLATVMAWVTVE